MAKNKKGKKKAKSKDKKLSKHLKALANELQASREKEAQLVEAVKELTDRVEALQTHMAPPPPEEKEPESTRRGTTPRAGSKSTKTKVASTKKAKTEAKSKPTAKRGRPKKRTTAPAAAGPSAVASGNGSESAPEPPPTKVARQTKSRTTPKPKTSTSRRGRPRQKKEVAGDDLTVISGLGKSIAGLLHKEGVTTYREMAKLAPTRFQEILQDAGPRYKNKDPQPWIAAAAQLATS